MIDISKLQQEEATSTIHYLLSHYLTSTFKTSRLLKISAETLHTISEELNDRFPELELTTDDVKAAWKAYFDTAVNGCIVLNENFSIQLSDSRHAELDIYDQLIETACNAIDQLS